MLAEAGYGYAFAQGIGGPVDLHQAYLWYRKSADQGLAWAQTEAGKLIEHGQGVAKNEPAARALYEKAANQGDAEAVPSEK